MSYTFHQKTIRFLLLLTIVVIVAACGEKKIQLHTTANSLQYVERYTRGPIASDASIVVRFKQDLGEKFQAGIELDDLLQSEPAIQGRCVVSSANTIEFTPDHKFKHGQLYQFKLRLTKLFSKAEADFDFKIQVVPLQVDFISLGLIPDPRSPQKTYLYSGKLLFTDKVDMEKAKSCIQAEYMNQALKIDFRPMESDKELVFDITEVVRQEEAQALHLHIDVSPLDIDYKSEQEIRVPGFTEFEITQVKPINESSQYIEIQFSDNLKKKQNLQGLIEIIDIKTSKFLIQDNLIKVYPSKKLTGSQELKVYPGIRSEYGIKLKDRFDYQLSFPSGKPEVAWIKEGVILPNSEGLHLAFKAINLRAVDVTITKVYENNVLQFLQDNDFNDNTRLKKVAKPLFKKRLHLEDPSLRLDTWHVFSIDLSQLVEQEQGAIYRVKISFKKEYAALPCLQDQKIEGDDNLNQEIDWSEWKYSEDDYYWWDDEDYPYGYDWDKKDDPCDVSYYTSDRWIEQNVLATNLAVIAKKGEDNSFHITVTDIRTTLPVNDVEISIYNYQQQLIRSAKTDDNGFCNIYSDEEAFALVAQKNGEKAYLRLIDGAALSVSRFDVNGKRSQNGLKAFIYGERGVWRPGDSLHLSVILHSEGKKLPDNYPLTLRLYNPMGQLIKKISNNQSTHHLYVFHIPTQASDPTGLWRASITAGGVIFNQNIRIETVKPNRYKVALTFDDAILSASKRYIDGKLKINWLHGAPAKNTQYDIQLSLKKKKTEFTKYDSYIFDDPVNSFYPDEYEFAEGRTDEKGYASVRGKLESYNHPPGMLKANFMIRAYEPGGNFSTNYVSRDFSPYEAYVGIRMPEPNKYGYYETGQDNKIEIASLDKDGKPLSLNGLKVELYRINWRWWYDVYTDQTSNFYSNSYNQLINTQTINTHQGKGVAQFNIPDTDWGRYFVHITIPGGHSTGAMFFADWPYTSSRANRKNPDGASVLSFATDKEKYQVGDLANISFPSSKIGRALVSIEDGSSVLQSFWVEADPMANETHFSLEIKEEMSPNVYVHISLLQPHAQTLNDSPIRSYGIIPLLVENPDSHLHPKIKMKDKLRPEEEFTVTISEQSKRRMTYTLAIVDEGLLDLTNYHTPDPWKYFYAKEALGVKTWDFYDMILGAYGGEIEKLFAVGGDEDLPQKGVKKAKRFKPVVFFAGPFTYDGKKQKHHFKMPSYVGSVKVMVVAKDDNSFGKTDKVVAVKNPLMILPTLPRTMSPGDEAAVPVSVFAMEKDVKDVTLRIQTNEYFEIPGDSQQKVHFDSPDEKTLYFKIKALQKIGIGKIEISAKAGKHKAKQSVELDVRSSNPKETRVLNIALEKGENHVFELSGFGLKNSQKAYVEISTLPSLDIKKRLHYLIHYPYGCSEQISSSAFAQLHLESLIKLDDVQKKSIQNNIQEAISLLQGRVNFDGGIKYWPSSEHSNEWISSYVGQFLWEAQEKAYYVPQSMMKEWLHFQQNRANQWKVDTYSTYSRIFSKKNQAYRLYVLALTGNAEIGAMNRLREIKNLGKMATWYLGAAYALCGKKDIALKLIASTDSDIEKYDLIHNYSFGSRLRDKAMILNVLKLLDKKQEMHKLLFDIAHEVSRKSWMSTQTTAVVFNSLGKIFQNDNIAGNTWLCNYSINEGARIKAGSDKQILHLDLDFDEQGNTKFEINNISDKLLFVNVFNEGNPPAGEEKLNESNIHLSVFYTDMQNNRINPSNLAAGTDFLMHVSAKANYYYDVRENMVLNTMFPPGWEIIHTRLSDFDYVQKQSSFTYQDIRDDRIYTFFDLSTQVKTFTFVLHAAYQGKYYLPSVRCEAMYDNTISGNTHGRWVEVY
jgi:uncharacterized protein YfaS (alpha-2-macroglobulin family)